ncbi:MAG: hypothetical protein ACKO2K_12950 [Alphaproteobacteria bacterium]
MKSKFTSFAATAALLVSGTVALAGSPMPNPPFTTALYPTGPDAKALLKTEASVNGLINKALGSGAKCYQKGVSNIFGGKPDGTAACLGGLATQTGAIGKVLVGLGKIEDKAPAGSTTCILNGLLAQVSSLTGLIPSLLPVALCEGTADINASPLVAKICGGVVGGPSCTSDLDCASGTCDGADYGTPSYIPSNKDVLKTETSAIGIASKAGAAVAKCIDKAVAAEVKLPGSSNANLCINNAKLSGLTAVNKLAVKTAQSPSCLLGTGQSANIIATTNSLADAILSIGDVIYCN